MKIFMLYFSFTCSLFAHEAQAAAESNILAIAMFFIFVVFTLGITHWAAKRTRTAKDFYVAGRGGISSFQNGLAISGDYISAASFLGVSGLVYLHGFDGLIYSVGFLVGWPIIIFLVAEQLRNLGKYTFADVASYRLKETPIRILASVGSLATILLYLISQFVGAGKIMGLLFDLPFYLSVILVGSLITALVFFGGMLASTWVQIVKAVLLLVGATILVFLIMYSVDFSFITLFSKTIEAYGSDAIIKPGLLVADPISTISLAIALMFGVAGLPHIFMRFFTVSNAKQARESVFYATGFIGYFYILTFLIGFGAIVFVSTNPLYTDLVSGAIIGGGNMALMHLSHVLGGDIFFGFISAVAMVTILAVISGLTLSGASAISHDLYISVIAKNSKNKISELKVYKYATVGISAVSIIFAIAFEYQNIAYLVGLAFAFAASANFPILLLSLYWKKLTTRGAVIGGSLGLLTVAILFFLGPVVWGEILHGDADAAIFPYKYPALFSVTIAFVSIWFFSITDKSEDAQKEIEAFDEQYMKSQIGI